MPELLRLFLLHETDLPPAAPDPCAGLGRAGWQVCTCHGMRSFEALARASSPGAVVVRTSARRMGRRIAQVRIGAPAAAVVALLPAEAGAGARIAAMNAGADACCDIFVGPSELAAVLRAVLRRRGVPAMSTTGARQGWRLLEERLLAGPEGQRLPLTRSEAMLVQALLAAPGGRLPRPDAGGRSMDVTVARLRAKAAGLGLALPLYAVRRWGYVFLPQEPQAPAQGLAEGRQVLHHHQVVPVHEFGIAHAAQDVHDLAGGLAHDAPGIRR
ncbi:response regulator transcription factor [Bordetella sp. 2513F-2]